MAVVKDVDEQVSGVPIDATVIMRVACCRCAFSCPPWRRAGLIPFRDFRAKASTERSTQRTAQAATAIYLATGSARRQRGHEMYPSAALDPAT